MLPCDALSRAEHYVWWLADRGDFAVETDRVPVSDRDIWAVVEKPGGYPRQVVYRHEADREEAEQKAAEFGVTAVREE